MYRAMDGKINKNRTGLLVSLLCLLLLMLTAFQCDNEKPVEYQPITFVLPVMMVPQDSVFNIGDTVSMEVAVSDSLYEYHTKKKYKLPNFDFGQTSIVVRKLINNKLALGDQQSAASKFDIVEEIGSILFPGETFIDFKYFYSLDSRSYLLKIGFVPKETGVFCINLLSPRNLKYKGNIDLGISSEGTPIIPMYEDLFFPMNNGDNNFDLFEIYCWDNSFVNPENYRNNYYIRKGTFTFSVVE